MSEFKIRGSKTLAWETIRTKRSLVRIKPTWEYSAHRGYEVGYPENSLASLVKAKEKGFGYSECDVQFTSDNVPVICHNATVGGYTIANETAETITGVELGVAPRFGSIKVPTLKQYLDCAYFIGAKLVIHARPDTEAKAKLITSAVMASNMQDNVIYITGSLQCMTWFAQSYKNARVHYCPVGGIQIPADLTNYKALLNYCAHIGFNVDANYEYTDEDVARVFENGMEMSFWNVSGSDYARCMSTHPIFLTLKNNGDIDSGWDDVYIAALNLW